MSDTTSDNAIRRYAQLEGERNYYKRLADQRGAKLAAIGQLSPTDYDDREQLLGALFRILRGQQGAEEETPS